MLKTKKTIIVITLVYIVTLIFWFLFNFFGDYTPIHEGTLFIYLLIPFLIGMTILPLLGGLFDIIESKKWGGVKSAIGRSIISLSLGLITWGAGMIVWNYYLFFTDIEIPYPSLADVFFIMSWPLWTYGIFQLSIATGAKFTARKKKGKLILFIIPIVIALASYYLLFHIARGGVIQWNGNELLKSFFDLFYPLGDIVILTITVLVYLLSKEYLGGIGKKPVLLLLTGFLMNYFSDFMFSYTTTKGTYFNGHLVDSLFVTVMFILSLGIALLDPDRGKTSS